VQLNQKILLIFFPNNYYYCQAMEFAINRLLKLITPISFKINRRFFMISIYLAATFWFFLPHPLLSAPVLDEQPPEIGNNTR
jgi:hypothetical protein